MPRIDPSARRSAADRSRTPRARPRATRRRARVTVGVAAGDDADAHRALGGIRAAIADGVAGLALGRTYDGARSFLIGGGIIFVVVVIAIAILPFLTPAWVSFEQGRAQAAA